MEPLVWINKADFQRWKRFTRLDGPQARVMRFEIPRSLVSRAAKFGPRTPTVYYVSGAAKFDRPNYRLSWVAKSIF